MTLTVNKPRAFVPLLNLALLVGMPSLGGCKPSSQVNEPFEDPYADKLYLGGCSRAAVIDDGEDDDHRILIQEDRGGYLFTFMDANGTTITPKPGSQAGAYFDLTGANGSMFGGRFYGDVGVGSSVYAGYGMNLREPMRPYDASKYTGLTFFARRAPDSISQVRVKLPDKQTDPNGGICSECYNAFGKDLELTEKWQQYVIPFEEMQQEPSWGSPRPASIDAETLYSIQFQVSAAGQHFDIWIDDLSFYGCDGE